MINKIIQKEKDVQKGLINRAYDSSNVYFNAVTMLMDFHKDTLINLKEYMELEQCQTQDHWESIDSMKTGVTGCDAIVTHKGLYNSLRNGVIQNKEDIKELNKMIERYK